MTRIRLDGSFDWEAVAKEFHGALTFRGNIIEGENTSGVVEIEGDVDEYLLRVSIVRNSASITRWLDAPRVLGAPPLPAVVKTKAGPAFSWPVKALAIAPGAAALAIEIARWIR